MLAYWHHPLYSSSRHRLAEARPMWKALYDYDADLILGAHQHAYERFAAQNPWGNNDAARGMRQINAGTGGAVLYPFEAISANSEVRIREHGVLKLTLEPDRYTWEFIGIGGEVKDSGTTLCH